MASADDKPTSGASARGVRLLLVAPGVKSSDGFYRRGSFLIPTDPHNPLVIDLEALLAQKTVVINDVTLMKSVGDKQAPVTGADLIAELESDTSIVKLRSDAPLTANVVRYKPQ